MEKIKISNISEEIGILSYDIEKEKFYFKYSETFKGFPFGDINCKEGREFTSDTIFSMFSYTKSYNRDYLLTKYNLDDADSNKSQWFFLKLWTKKKMCIDGLYYEII